MFVRLWLFRNVTLSEGLYLNDECQSHASVRSEPGRDQSNRVMTQSHLNPMSTLPSILSHSVRTELAAARTVLIVDAPAALDFLSRRPGEQGIVLTQRHLLSEAMLRNVGPDLVIGPLITPDWDVVDLGLHLQSLGYQGNFYALTKPLPRADLVLREVSAVCPSLTVRLIEAT